ncbi:MAG: amino acid ABC transporter substrate-binding protein [Desulfobacterales bacterium]|nr:amino acid ABC transporter substrate-binding protein [Desulfobacterales bacterium]
MKFTLITIFSIVFFFTVQTHSQTRVVLVIEPYPPFALGIEETITTKGIAVEIAHEIFRRIPEATLEVQLLSWARLMVEVRMGRKDGILLIYKNPEREKFMEYTLPVFSGRHVIVYSKEKNPKGIIWKTYEDLIKYKYGKVHSYSINPAFDLLITQGRIKPVTVTREIHNFKSLIKRKIDFFISNDFVANNVIKTNGWQDLIFVGDKEISRRDWFISFSKKSSAKRFIPQVNKAILEMEADGTMKRIKNSGFSEK